MGRNPALLALPPRGGQQKRVPRFWSSVQALDKEGATQLLEVTRDIIGRSMVLMDYVDRQRREARTMGVETIAIELSAIMEGGRLDNVIDALEDATETGRRPEITLDGFSKLRRAEHLVGEADLTIAEYTESSVMGGSHMHGSEWSRHCHACGSSSGAALSDIPVTLLVLGVIGAGAILTIITLAIIKNSK